MHAQNTLTRHASITHGRATASLRRQTVLVSRTPSSGRQGEQRFWLLVYGVLVVLISLLLVTSVLLFWMNSYFPTAALANAPLVVPNTNQPAVSAPDKNSGPAIEVSHEAGAAQPTPAELDQIAPVAQPTEVVPAQSAEPTSTQAEPVLESTPVIEPTATPEPTAQPARREIYLELGDDYHSQLSVPNGSSACGPTALLIALDYYDLQSSLPELVAQASFDPKAGGYDPTCTDNVVCMSPQALVKLASEDYGLDVQYGEGWSFEQIYDALQSGGPVIVDIAWDPSSSTLGHFVVIYGIDLDNQKVYYHDPYSGAGISVSWDEFQYRWSHTVDVGDPLQDSGYTRWGMAIYMR